MTWDPGDAWVLKLHVNGTVDWQRAYGGPDTESARAILQAADGSIVVAGITELSWNQDEEAWVLKLDQLGNVHWQTAYGGVGDDTAMAVVPTAEGGFAVAGKTEAFGNGGADAWLLKMANDGVIHGVCNLGQASKATIINTVVVSVNSSATEEASSIVPADSSATAANTNVDALYLCSTEEAPPFAATYGTEEQERIRDIVQTRDGGYIAAARRDGDVWVLKLEASGRVTWQRAYGLADYSGASAIEQTTDGGYLLAGKAGDYGWLLKLSADGNTAWCRILEPAILGICRQSGKR
jgi:hypothetical protein